MRTLLLSAGSAFAVSALLVPLCRAAGLRLGYVSVPRHDRWHQRPTPLFGGIAIGVTVLLLGATLLDIRENWVLALGGAGIFAVGLIDDLISLKPHTKLVAQIALASMFVFFGYRLGWSDSLTLDALLTLVWIVGLTNAFNLLDNMDGLCAGIALIAGSMLLTTLILRQGVAALDAQYLSLLLGATAGFLRYNMHPARIFMGDSGSLFIGLNLAVLTLSDSASALGTSDLLSIIAAPLLILLVPIFDTTLVTISRVLSGRSAAQGGRDHSSHRLVAIGLSERDAVLVLWALAALGGGLGIAMRGFDSEWSSLAGAVFILAMIIFAVYLAQVRVYEDVDEAAVRSGRLTPFRMQFVYKRRVAEVLLDLSLVSIAYYSAYRVRFEGSDWTTAFPRFIESLPIIVGVQMLALFFVGVYRGVWRHFGLMDGVVLARGIAIGTVSSICVIVYVYRFSEYSRGVFVIYAALMMLMFTASRASFRLIAEFIRRRSRAGRRLIVYGAGDGGAIALRELLHSSRSTFRVVGLVDDDPRKWRTRIQGYPVLGGYDTLQALIEVGAVDTIVISARLFDVTRLQTLQTLCASRQVELLRLHFELHGLVAVS